jgi:hypothetical protein
MKARDTTKGVAWRPHDSDKYRREHDRIFRRTKTKKQKASK